MFSSRVFSFVLLSLTVSVSSLTLVKARNSPFDGQPPPGNIFATNVKNTDVSTIASTIGTVQQRRGPTLSTPPDLPVPDPFTTADDGRIEDLPLPNNAPRRRSLSSSGTQVDKPAFQKVFDGTGAAGGSQRDAAIEGTAYLTYTLVKNSTYNVNDCQTFCASTNGCAFVNLYYEFNNINLDSGPSNLKCVAFGDVHTAVEKTNRGGQLSYPIVNGQTPQLTYIQKSSGWKLIQGKKSPRFETPEGYELVSIPNNKANVAPYFLGFYLLDRYDLQACARLCTARTHDHNGGPCTYWNIWRAVANDVPKSYTCALYYVPPDRSTATYGGESDIEVTDSQGYRRVDYIKDGGFEGYQGCKDFCSTSNVPNWVLTSGPSSSGEATVVHFTPFARAGSSFATLESDSASPATLAPAQSIKTVAGNPYIITNWCYNLAVSNTTGVNASMEVIWNGVTVSTVPVWSNDEWTYTLTAVTGTGQDTLAFRGAMAQEGYVLVDDVHVYSA